MPRMASAATHPEMRLLLACATLAPDLARVRELAVAKLDWGKLSDAAEYHGLTPLLLRNLQQANVAIPEAALRVLEERNGKSVRQNLFLTSELLRILQAIKGAKIEVVPLKGAALAEQVYGDLGLRPFSDIDLLIRREQIESGEAVARSMGYEPEFAIPPEHRDRWLMHQCELTFRRSNLSRLELHWDIAHPHFALCTGVEDFWPRLATVRIGDTNVSNLSESDLLFMLMVHGTRHAWSRLMWVVDVAELLRTSPTIDWAAFLKNANERGAERMVATALVLVRDALGPTVGDSAVQALYADPIAKQLASGVFLHWNEAFERGDLSDLEPSPLWRHCWIMKTRENRSQRWTYARRVLTVVGDEEFGAARLPRVMAPFYKAVRFWNVFRKARPKSMAASAQGKS